MLEVVPFRLTLTGESAENHEFQGYDGYMALAGFAWALSLATNYANTGKIRQRGDFDGRQSVRAKAIDEGSIIADFVVAVSGSPNEIFGLAAAATGAQFLYALVARIISRNLGTDIEPDNDALEMLLANRGGDIEALVAISEAPIRQAHSIIGNGASQIVISAGINIINTFNANTRDYVKLNIEDRQEIGKTVSVSAFNANSGYGSVFDPGLGRVLPFSMSRDTLRRYGAIFAWGLAQYVSRTGLKIDINFTRILAMDGTPKRYVISSAHRLKDQ